MRALAFNWQTNTVHPNKLALGGHSSNSSNSHQWKPNDCRANISLSRAVLECVFCCCLLCCFHCLNCQWLKLKALDYFLCYFMFNKKKQKTFKSVTQFFPRCTFKCDEPAKPCSNNNSNSTQPTHPRNEHPLMRTQKKSERKKNHPPRQMIMFVSCCM